MFISQTMSEQQMPELLAPQRLMHTQGGEGDPELGAYTEGQPHLPAVLLTLKSTATHRHTILQSSFSRKDLVVAWT